MLIAGILGLLAIPVLAQTDVPVATPSMFQQTLDKVSAFGQSMKTDVVTNTRFKIDSSVGFTAADWKRGIWTAGTAIPFAQVGSYVYTAVYASWAINQRAVSSAGLMEGIRLNDVTRPLVKKLFNALTIGNIDKVPLLEGLANATTLTVHGGHDFNYTEKSKVVINAYGIGTGIEIAFGGVKLASKPAEYYHETGHWYIR